MKYYVLGGIFENTDWEELINSEFYGPFDSYEEAKDVWQAKVWLNVDNCLHRLYITSDADIRNIIYAQ